MSSVDEEMQDASAVQTPGGTSDFPSEQDEDLAGRIRMVLHTLRAAFMQAVH